MAVDRRTFLTWLGGAAAATALPEAAIATHPSNIPEAFYMPRDVDAIRSWLPRIVGQWSWVPHPKFITNLCSGEIYLPDVFSVNACLWSKDGKQATSLFPVRMRMTGDTIDADDLRFTAPFYATPRFCTIEISSNPIVGVDLGPGLERAFSPLDTVNIQMAESGLISLS